MEKIVESIKEMTQVALRIAPIAQIIQYILVGALFGLLKGALRNKLKLSEAVSAIVTGFIHILVLGVVPHITVSVFI
ncbi:MAG: hypothetical protein QW543_02005 [Sulfolobales archaeon]